MNSNFSFVIDNKKTKMEKKDVHVSFNPPDKPVGRLYDLLLLISFIFLLFNR